MIYLMKRPNGVTETAMDTAIIMNKALTWLIISHPMELNGMIPMAMATATIHMAHGDWFPSDPNRWQDSDQDGVANEDDAFPNNPTQSVDSDGDGYGDDPNGTDYDDFT